MGGGGDEKTVTRNVNEPFAEQKGYLENLYARATKRSEYPLSYYPFSTVTERQPYTQMGLDKAAALGMGSSPYREGVGAMADATFRGDYLSPSSNPWLQETFDVGAKSLGDAFNRTVMPGIAARYGAAGRVGSPDEMAAYGRAQEGLAEGLGQFATSLYGGAYDTERNRQIQLAQMAPSLEQARYGGAEALTRSGLLSEDYGQRVLDDWVNRFEFQRDEPDLRLARLSGLLGSPVTGSGVSTTKRSSGSDTTTQAIQAAAALGTLFFL